MGVDYITLAVRWQGRYCGRRGNDGQPVAGGCDFHGHTNDGQACFRFGPMEARICGGDLVPVPIDLDMDGEGRTVRCSACIEEYGED